MRARAATAAGAVLSLSIALIGCSQQQTPGSSITVEYELDGQTLSVEMRPDGVDCTDSGVGASAALQAPVGIFTFGRAIGEGPDRLTGAVQVDGGTLYVTSDDVALPEIVDGVLDLPTTGITGTLAEDPDSPDDGIPVTGTLAAHLECEARE